MINDYNSLSGLQKVAVLFSVVGEGLALSLVKGLSKTGNGFLFKSNKIWKKRRGK